MKIFESIYNNANLFRLQEGKTLDTTTEIIKSIQKNDKSGKRYIETLLNGKQYLPDWIRNEADTNPSEELIHTLDRAVELLKDIPKDCFNNAICLLIRKSDNITTMNNILNQSLDALVQYALVAKNNWATSDESFQDLLDYPYDRDEWKNFERRMISLKSQRRAIKGKELSEEDRKNLYDTIWESPNWGLYIPKSFEGDSELASHMDTEKGKASWCTAAEKLHFDNYTGKGNYPLYVIKYFENGKYTEAWQVAFLKDSVEFMDKDDERNFDFVLKNAPKELLENILNKSNNDYDDEKAKPIILEYREYLNTYNNREKILGTPLKEFEYTPGLLLGLIKYIPEMDLDNFYYKYMLNLPDNIDYDRYLDSLNRAKNNEGNLPLEYFIPNLLKIDISSDINSTVFSFISLINDEISDSIFISDTISDIETGCRIEKGSLLPMLDSFKDKYRLTKDGFNLKYYLSDIQSALDDPEINEIFSNKEDLLEAAFVLDNDQSNYSYTINDLLKLYGHITNNISLPIDAFSACCNFKVLLGEDTHRIILDNAIPELYKIFDKLISFVKSNILTVEEAVIFVPLCYRLDIFDYRTFALITKAIHKSIKIDLSDSSKWLKIAIILHQSDDFSLPISQVSKLIENFYDKPEAKKISFAIFNKVISMLDSFDVDAVWSTLTNMYYNLQNKYSDNFPLDEKEYTNEMDNNINNNNISPMDSLKELSIL